MLVSGGATLMAAEEVTRDGGGGAGVEEDEGSCGGPAAMWVMTLVDEGIWVIAGGSGCARRRSSSAIKP